MSDRWQVLDVDVREGVASIPAHTDADVFWVVLWWGSTAVGTLVLRREQLPVSDAFIRHRFADIVAPVVLARECPGGRVAPHTDGAPPPAALAGHQGIPDDRDRWLDELLIGHVDGSPAPTLPDVGVVLCTRGRGDALRETLLALTSQNCVPAEIVVVDNNPEPDPAITRLVEATPGACLVHEPRPGLSSARNAGIRQVTSAVVAFTDDDAIPAPNWTTALARTFVDPAIGAVTGLVLPAALDTKAAVHFQMVSGGLGGSFVPLVFDRGFYEAAKPRGVPVWRIGSGANLAVRRVVFERVGGFDERLGAGASGCSEDSELLFRLLADGGTVVNEPRAVVRHRHRATTRSLVEQAHSYQRGHVSALIAQADRHDDSGSRHRLRRELPRHHATTALWQLQHPRPRGWMLYLADATGFLRGLGYLARRSWRNDNELAVIAPVDSDHKRSA